MNKRILNALRKAKTAEYFGKPFGYGYEIYQPSTKAAKAIAEALVGLGLFVTASHASFFENFQGYRLSDRGREVLKNS